MDATNNLSNFMLKTIFFSIFFLIGGDLWWPYKIYFLNRNLELLLATTSTHSVSGIKEDALLVILG